MARRSRRRESGQTGHIKDAASSTTRTKEITYAFTNQELEHSYFASRFAAETRGMRVERPTIVDDCDS